MEVYSQIPERNIIVLEIVIEFRLDPYMVGQIILEFSAQTVSGEGIDEIYENREQIEIARYYEQLPKPSLIATQELLEGTLCFKRPEKEDSLEQSL